MITVYKIINTQNNKIYFGITRTTLNRRFNNHVYWSKRKNTPLYAAIRKYGLDKFSILPILYCETWEYTCEIEKKLIASYDNLYNLASGGEGGFNVLDIGSWKKRLSVSRTGRKPFLGRKHTEETKKKCGEASKLYWTRVRSNEPC